MRVYFTSSELCALRLGGVFAGFCSEHEKFVDLSEDAKIVAEFFPENARLLPLSFLLDGAFFSAPPDFADVYDFGCGALVHIRSFSLRGEETSVLSQVREGNFLATLYKDSALRIALEGGGEFAVKTLPYNVRSAKLTAFSADGAAFFALEEETDREDRYFALFKGTAPVFEGRVLSCSRPDTDGRTMETRQALRDAAGHVATGVWELHRDGLKLVRYEVKEREGFSPAALDRKILPFAFFQTLLARGNYKAYLSDALLPRAEKLAAYLGNFSGVVLPPSVFYLQHGETDAVGLVYPEKFNLFRVRFFTAPSENGKIINIMPVE